MAILCTAALDLSSWSGALIIGSLCSEILSIAIDFSRQTSGFHPKKCRSLAVFIPFVKTLETMHQNPRKSAVWETFNPPHLAPTIMPLSETMRSHFPPKLLTCICIILAQLPTVMWLVYCMKKQEYRCSPNSAQWVWVLIDNTGRIASSSHSCHVICRAILTASGNIILEYIWLKCGIRKCKNNHISSCIRTCYLCIWFTKAKADHRICIINFPSVCAVQWHCSSQVI